MNSNETGDLTFAGKGGAWPWLLAMIILQTAWLATMLLTKASSQTTLVLGVMLWTLATGSLCLLLAQRTALNWGPNSETHQFLLLLAAGLAICIAYSFLQRPWADEVRWNQFDSLVHTGGISGLIGSMFRDGVGAKLDSPLPVIVRGYLMRLLPNGLGYVRMAACIVPLGYITATYLAGRKLYNHSTGLVAGLLLMSTPYFARIGASILSDMWISLFFGLAVLQSLALFERPSISRSLGLGLLLGLGCLSKYTMVLAFPLLLVAAWLFGAGLRALPWLALSFSVGLALLTPWVWVIYHAGVLKNQGTEMALYAGQWLQHGGPSRWTLESIFIRFPSAIGVYMFPLFALGAAILKPLTSRKDLFILVWALAVFIPVVFTTPDPRYFMPAFPALTIAAARGLLNIKGRQALVLASFFFALGSWYLFMDWHRAALLIQTTR